jgi:dihydrofolate synthase
MLHASGVRCGRFTSPHLIDRWDCISVGEQTVEERVFRDAEATIRHRDRTDGIGATEFELLTAIALEIFARERIEMGVVEVGLGGRLDATNILRNKAVTVIAKIGLDHQSFLGNTIEAISSHKAGIMKPGVPCVLDKSNAPSVRKIVEGYGEEIGADVIYSSTETPLMRELSQGDYEPHQLDNLASACSAFHLAYTGPSPPQQRLLSAVRNLQWPGRLQEIDIRGATGRKQSALLDGAHNAQSAEVLGTYVDRKFRSRSSGVTWVIAASKGKALYDILKPLIRKGDYVIAVEFGPVDGMPWVESTESHLILTAASAMGLDQLHQYDSGSDILAAMKRATEVAADGPLIIAGSLYLVSDVLRLLRTADQPNS